jgi:hypothetical protein
VSVLQGLVSYPGLTTFARAEYTLSQGISPGICSIEMPLALAADIQPFGDLTISYGDTQITLPNCAIRDGHLANSIGGQIATINIMDRRWMWSNKNGGGSISGHYNLRMPTGTNADEGFNSAAAASQGDSTQIRSGTEKAPQDIANLCFEAMNEQNGDCSALPNDARPEIDWSHTNPAEALQQLCEGLGCRVTYVIDSDSVVIVSIGQGNTLPDNGIQTFPSIGVNPQIAPSALKLYGGATVFQGLLQLEAVGIDTDGSVKLIDDLSYAPTGINGWQSEDPNGWASFSVQKDPTIFALVEKSIYKMWRITLPIQIPQTANAGNFDPPTDIRQIHLYDRLIETHFDPNDPAKIIAKKPLLFGYFEEKLRQEIKTQKQTPQAYRGALTVDADRWLIITDDPLVLYVAGQVLEANLYVKIAYSVRDPNKWQPHFCSFTRQLNSTANTQARIIKREEIFVKVIGTFDPTSFQLTGATDNMQSDDLQAEANYYLDAAQSEYIEQDSIDTEYAGIVDIQVDGLIQQVTHTIVAGPNGYAKTRASLATEHNPYVLPWAARRAKEKAGQAKAEREQLEKDCPFMRSLGPFRSGAF